MMRQRWSKLSLCALLLAGWSLAWADQERHDELDDVPIIEVRFIGNEDVDDDELCDALVLGEGDPFSAEQLELSRQKLLELDKFTAAEVSVERDDKGLIVIFTMEEKWHVMSVPLVGKNPRSAAACRAKLNTTQLSDLEGLTIEAIRFEDNKTTRAKVLREEILFEEGDTFSVAKLIESRQLIKNLGLFKRVWARAERGDNGVIVTFTVREKWFVLPIPTLDRNSDGDLSYGGELTWDNLWGLNHNLKFKAKQEDQASGETQQSLSLDYKVPKFIGTPWGMRAGVKRERTLSEYAPDEADPPPTGDPSDYDGTYYEYFDRLNISATRWLKRISPSQGWIGGSGITWSRTYYEAVSGNPLLEDNSRQLNLNFNGGYTAVNDFEYYRSGQTFGASLDVGRENLGSSENYTTVQAYWRRYQPLQVPLQANLDMQLQGGYNVGLDEPFELGGADSIRGIPDNNRPVGDVYALLNLNWLIPIPRYPAFRWNIFTDIGNAWDRDDIDPLRLKATLGVGARWKIRTLVNTSLRLDIGVDPATGEFKVYAGTSEMF